MLEQDVHIHTTYSTGDSAVVPEQTVDLVASVKHAKIVGISDHFDYLVNGAFQSYAKDVRSAGLKVGVEIDGHPWVDEATQYDVDYYIFHCRDRNADYRSLDHLLATRRPVIIAHPNYFNTDLKRVAPDCFIEINNRYVWLTNWKQYYGPFASQFRFVIGSDAHQPNWLSQSVAQYAARQLGIKEHLVF